MTAIILESPTLEKMDKSHTVRPGQIDWWNSEVLKDHIKTALAPFRDVLPEPDFTYSVSAIQLMVHADCPRDLDAAQNRVGQYVEKWAKDRLVPLSQLQIEADGKSVRIGVPEETAPPIIDDVSGLKLGQLGILTKKPNTPWGNP
jgi:hypothetical protein